MVTRYYCDECDKQIQPGSETDPYTARVKGKNTWLLIERPRNDDGNVVIVCSECLRSIVKNGELILDNKSHARIKEPS